MFDIKYKLSALQTVNWHLMQFVPLGDNLHKMSNPVFWKNENKIKVTEI